MVILPIIERELRTAAHQPRTWWRRVLACGIGIIIMTFVYLEAYRYANAPRIGQQLFEGLAGFCFVFALCAGPLATSDCISSEKRNGTLGLLFLTDLRSRDVVLGKLFASSLSLFFIFLTLLPLVSLPLIMGGVALKQFATMLVTLLSTFFLSLATGLLASAVCTSARAALLLNTAFMGVLTIGIPAVAAGLFEYDPHDPGAWLVYMLCPLELMNHAFSSFSRMPEWRFWLNVSATQMLAVGCVAAAGWFTARVWQDRPASVTRLRWRERWRQWSAGAGATQAEYRRRALARNPMFWLDDRYRWQKYLMWLGLGTTLAVYQYGWLNDRPWAIQHEIIIWGMLLNYSLCLWVILQTTHRFCQDRESGALELLLATPLSTMEIIRGRMLALRSQFGWALVFGASMDGFMIVVWCMKNPNDAGWFNNDGFVMACTLGTLLLPVQAWMLAQVGLYLSLRHKSALTAALGAIWRVHLIPWLFFFIFVIAYDSLRVRRIISIRGEGAVIIWFLLQMAPGMLFTLIAGYHLRFNFRVLAAQSVRTPWWWRILRI